MRCREHYVIQGEAQPYQKSGISYCEFLLDNRAGCRIAEPCFLRLAPLSWLGALILGAMMLFIPATLLAGRGQPFHWLDALVYAPASALGQELFFRSALLAALLHLCRNRARTALTLQSGVFAL